jgi:hypothetical protein
MEGYRSMFEPKHLGSRRQWLAIAAFGIVLTFHPLAVRGQDGFEGFDANLAEQMLELNSVELRIQLQNGLRVFLPEQLAFLNTVIVAVDSGKIPRAMVNMVYVWAIRRNSKVPFPYYEIALRTLADRRGVTL